MQKKLMPIVVILIIAAALLAFGGGALAKEAIDSGDISEKPVKPDIEVEDALIIDDPPFLTILRTKLYYYDFRNVNILTGVESSSGYTARNFAVSCYYTSSLNTPSMRTLRDFSTNKMFRTHVMPGVYNYSTRQPMARWGGMWSKMTDYSVWQAIDTGTDELMGETLQYIDYNRSGGMTRCYLKDGDVYAMLDVRRSDGSSANVVTYVSNATGNPPSSYFTHPRSWEDSRYRNP